MRLGAVRIIFFLAAVCLAGGTVTSRSPATAFPGLRAHDPHDLVFPVLAGNWDEGLPLGNGTVGALVWRKGNRLRLSLDRADLWDLRPMPNLSGPEWTFRWVVERWADDEYKAVQDRFDAPYETSPAPTKIPAAALEIDLSGFGPEASVRLDVAGAVARVDWENGRCFIAFVTPGAPVGLFRLMGAPAGLSPVIRPPAYGGDESGGPSDSVTGQDLRRLGYEQGRVEPADNLRVYRQNGWGGFAYEVAVAWEESPAGLVGAWSVTSTFSEERGEPGAAERARAALKAGFDSGESAHRAWWADYWSRAGIRVPDPVLEKQWYLETYKFGSAARRGAPPISLQAVWTADNGKLPPWKGDFHHDLNTQLSYWPCYSGNRLEEGLGFLDWLWERRPVFERYTRTYFGTRGLNVPGVTTLAGEPMGGWIPYSFSPTIGAWLAHHFDLHWRFSRDRDFLRDRAWPWVRDTAVHLEEISVTGPDGCRRLPLSSSPEIFDNSRRAWFARTTNYDLALVRWAFRTAAEMARELGLAAEADRWARIESEWPELAVDPESGLMFAPETPYRQSHRHFSHLMAFHPLGLVDGSRGADDRAVIRDTLAALDRAGPDGWVGYSYAWLGNLKARVFDGEGAAEALRVFATAFCLPNSFHANGDQTRSGFSRLTYRPFTLEGNFAFAAGLQEMLLQSHAGLIRVFPAVPKTWKDASFRTLRAQGAFLVSAEMSSGQTKTVRIVSEKGGLLRLANPFEGLFQVNGHKGFARDGVIEIRTLPGEEILFEFEEE